MILALYLQTHPIDVEWRKAERRVSIIYGIFGEADHGKSPNHFWVKYRKFRSSTSLPSDNPVRCMVRSYLIFHIIVQTEDARTGNA